MTTNEQTLVAERWVNGDTAERPEMYSVYLMYEDRGSGPWRRVGDFWDGEAAAMLNALTQELADTRAKAERYEQALKKIGAGTYYPNGGAGFVARAALTPTNTEES